jgi:hypothetical protein
MELTIAVLSWGAHRTLRNTLDSYRRFGLDAKQKVIFFQEIGGEDIAIAKEYGFDYIGTRTNIGISGGYRELLKASEQPLFLFLENDWELIEPAFNQILAAKSLLTFGQADVVRLRHRMRPGAPLWTAQFAGNELSRPEHLLDSLHWTPNPELIFPDYISKVGGWYFTKAKYANWTNNPAMFGTEWVQHIIGPRLSPNNDIELDIQQWWQEQFFTVAQGQGLFMHNRIG